jgi:hypothetical protein
MTVTILINVSMLPAHAAALQLGNLSYAASGTGHGILNFICIENESLK